MSESKNFYQAGQALIVKTDERAKIPTKAHPSDTGFDLTAIDVRKVVGNTILLGTGIHVKPPQGFAFEIRPRSSISKTEFVQANSVGTIDSSYTGELLIPWRNVSNRPTNLLAEELQAKLPFRAAQLILTPLVECSFDLVSELPESKRGDGGFGSTGS